jgi:predicted ABC-type ATPase
VARAQPPSLVVIAGPNGAGKSTLAPVLLKDTLSVTEFVNADVIARGLSEFAPEKVAMAAGRSMLDRLRTLSKRRVSFAFETTLASRTFAPRIRRMMAVGYEFHLVFLWLPNPIFALRRVADRVRMGGHGIPPNVVRRRYRAGLRNLFDLYMPMTTAWHLYDNSRGDAPRLVAVGASDRVTAVLDPIVWKRVLRGVGRGR